MRREEEIDLIRKAKEGDTTAFAEIIRRYQNLVYATAMPLRSANDRRAGGTPLS